MLSQQIASHCHWVPESVSSHELPHSLPPKDDQGTQGPTIRDTTDFQVSFFLPHSTARSSDVLQLKVQDKCMNDHPLPAFPITSGLSSDHTEMWDRQWRGECRARTNGSQRAHPWAIAHQALDLQLVECIPLHPFLFAFLVKHFTPQKLWLTLNSVTSKVSCSEKLWHLKFCCKSEVST